MQVAPAIDLLGDGATRLTQGDYAQPQFRRPALELVGAARDLRPDLIHLIDLEAARSGKLRPEILSECLAAAGDTPVQVGGGIRSVETAQAVLSLGAARVIVGSAAFASEDALAVFVGTVGDRLVVALDVDGGEVRVEGWRRGSGWSITDAAAHCVRAGVSRVLATGISRDGMGHGPDLDLYRTLRDFPFAVWAAGGVRGPNDLRVLGDLGCEGAVVGRAFAEDVRAPWLRGARHRDEEPPDKA